MYKKLFLLALLTCSASICSWSTNDIKLKVLTPTKGTNQSETPIPITAYVNGAELQIQCQIEGTNKVFIKVLGPEGIVYQREMDNETFNSIKVNLSQYRDGIYIINCQDTNGNEIEGDFVKENNE